VAQAEQSSKRTEAIRKFLAGGRNLAKLPEDRLKLRLERAQAFQQTPNLPADLMAALQKEEQDISAELSNRKSAGTAAEPQTNQATKATGKAPSSEVQATTPAAAQGSNEALDFIKTAQPAAGLPDNALRAQIRRAAQFSKAQGLSKQQRQQLVQIVRDGRAELVKRGQAGKPVDKKADGDTTAAAGQKTETGKSVAAAPASVSAFVQSVKPAADLNDKELRDQVRQAAQLSKTANLSGDLRQKLRQIMRDGRTELVKRSQGGTQAKTGTQENTTAPAGQQTGTKMVNPASDQKARAILDAKVDPAKLSNAELRKRLDSMRDLLASNDLAPTNKQELRQKLAAERALLRGRVGQNAKGNQTANTNNTTNNDTTINGNNNTVINNTTVINRTVVKRVLADRRPSRDLRDDDLRLRINVYRDVILDRNYSERERLEWRRFLDQDRLILRERMLSERNRRQDGLHIGLSNDGFSFSLGLNFEPDRPLPPRYVFAAEADDDELAEVLAAPPRRAISRRYSVEEVETSPDLRDAVSRIEIDTVRFGFGEGFLREEEIENLDRIAEIMEKILAGHPGEVFMIEGHTDAVGSDTANLQLSRERAKAVKEALVTYYVIPPENLKTVGFGERYLKIPTADAEPENRRVSVARITALVGALTD
jgi:outer membrane protein OmpA-like peptidoglycan-associated protein